MNPKCGPYLTVPEQWWEVKEEGLSEGHRLDGVVQVLTFVKLHLESTNKAACTFESETW